MCDRTGFLVEDDNGDYQVEENENNYEYDNYGRDWEDPRD